MALRNESPPPDSNDEDLPYDVVEGTAFSKIGFLSLIKTISTKLADYCQQPSYNIDERDLSPNESDEDLEMDDCMCRLMDMTVEPGILAFLVDIPLTDVLCEALVVNKSDRLNEIFIGILANFASNQHLCQQMSSDPIIVDQLVALWSSPNSSFLLECARLLKMVLQNEDCAPKWCHSIKCNNNFLSYVIFIFKSSICGELLISVMQVMSDLMIKDEELLEKYVSPELLAAILVARNEADWFSNNDVVYFHYILHLFSTQENGIVSLINNINVIYHGFSEYFEKISDEEPHLVMVSQHHGNVRLVLPTITVMISNMMTEEAFNVLQSAPSLLENMVRLAYSCKLQSEEDVTVQEMYLEISCFFDSVINISHSVMISNISGAALSPEVKWLQSIDVKASLPQLEAFLHCCIRNPDTRSRLTDMVIRLNLSYMHEALLTMTPSSISSVPPQL